MLNYFLRLKRKKAFTLVELVIVVAILAVLMASIAALSGPISRMVNRTASSADAIAANVIVGNYIENRLGFASKIEAYCGINPANATSGAAVTTSFNNMKGRLAITGNENDKAGILIFHYVADTAEPQKSHYELYDIPITATSSDYATTVLKAGALNEDNAVFADDFYGFSQNVMVFPTMPTQNKVRNDVYISVDIIPYDFDEESMVYNGSTIDTTVKQFISDQTINDYYEYRFAREAEIAAGGTITLTDETCTLGDLDIFRSGPMETLTFELQNILTTSSTDPTANLADRFKVVNCTDATSASITGADVMIFYYTPKYA